MEFFPFMLIRHAQIESVAQLHGSRIIARVREISSESEAGFEVDSRKWEELIAEMSRTPKPVGIGDIIERLAKPIAKALGLPCLDEKTGGLKPESPCAKRRDALNRLTE